MKKSLLLGAMAMVAGTAFAVTDGQTYETKNGLTCENVWIFDRFHDLTNYEANPIANKAARTATTDGVSTVYVGLSGDVATIEKFDLNTGAYLGSLPLKKVNADGVEEALTGSLVANQVGFDEYGHFYVAPYIANSDGTAVYTIYTVDLTTGLLTVAAELSMDGNIGRIDYCDVAGDLTCTEAPCTVLAAGNGTTPTAAVFWWTRAQGADTTWEPGNNGLCQLELAETYPADQTNLSNGPVAKIIKDGTGLLNMFYVDGFTTLPTVYANDGSLVDSFKNADLIQKDADGNITGGKVVAPPTGTNGMAEGIIGDKNFFIYSEGQYDGAHTCQAIITSVDADYSFTSIDPYWTVPADGLGQTSDGGTRNHSLYMVALPADANGKQAAYLVTFKCYNGLGVYRIAEEGYQPQGGIANTTIAKANIAVNGDVITVSEKANIEVYNVAGQKVAEAKNATEVKAPAAGLYVVKAGNTVAKVIVK